MLLITLIVLSVVGATIAAARLSGLPRVVGSPAWAGPDPLEVQAELRRRLGLLDAPDPLAEEIAATRAFAAANGLEAEALDVHADRLVGTRLVAVQAWGRTLPREHEHDATRWAERLEPVARSLLAEQSEGGHSALAVARLRDRLALEVVSVVNYGSVLSERRDAGSLLQLRLRTRGRPQGVIEPGGALVLAEAGDDEGLWEIDVPDPGGDGPLDLRLDVDGRRVGSRPLR